MSSLAAKEYADGVSGGIVISQDEVDEAIAFLGEARRATTGLPEGVDGTTRAFLDSALVVVRGMGPAEQVERLAQSLAGELRAAIDGTLVNVLERFGVTVETLSGPLERRREQLLRVFGIPEP